MTVGHCVLLALVFLLHCLDSYKCRFLLLSSLSLLFLLLMLGCKDQNRLLLIPLPMRVFSCIFLFCTIRFLLFLDTTHNNQTIAIDPIVVVSAVFIIFMVCSFLMVCSFPVLVAIGLVEIHGTGRRFLVGAGVSFFCCCCLSSTFGILKFG